MSHNIIVLVKQVPDTANISGNVMKDDGTVNRAKLPAIFNPEDMTAMELALQFRDRFGGGITALTMGPPKASEILRHCLYMGADKAVLVSDRKFAGADTLATSYVLTAAIRTLGQADIVFAGRQAIDGDTAQVGPQVAEKLGYAQISYCQEIIDFSAGKLTLRRQIDGGHELLRAPLPLLLTVVKDAVLPRPFAARRVMAYKNARTLMELEKLTEENSLLYIDELLHEYQENNLYIDTMTTDDLDIDVSRCGIHGSPTKVHKIESVVLAGNSHKRIDPSAEGLGQLIEELQKDHIFA
jgi:electron transfer flavoprotein beta subunit